MRVSCWEANDGEQTGQFKKFDDLPNPSLLRHMPRFQPDVFDENIKLLHEIEKMAKQKGCTAGQIALGWIVAQSGRKGLPEILPIPGATTEERVQENCAPAKLSEDDLAAIEDILKRFPVQGHRYPEEARAVLEQ